MDVISEAATKNGLPRRAFAFAPTADPTSWRLPFLDADGLPDPHTLALSSAALSEESVRESIPAVLLPAVKAKMRQAYRRMGRDDVPEALRETAIDVDIVSGALEAFAEKGSDDHFYGAWKGGSKAEGGGPGAAPTKEARRADMADRVGAENVGKPPTDGKAGTGKTEARPTASKWGAGPTVSASEAYDALNRGESPNVQPKEVRSFLAQAAAGDTHPDLTKLQVAGTMKFGGDGLGIKRADMPQLPGDRLPEFLAEMRGRGISVTEGKVDPASLKPIQSEVSSKKVGGMLNAMRDGTLPGGAIVTTRDGYVLDGHHRWGAGTALSFERKGVLIDEVRIGMDAKPLLKEALSWTERAGIARRGITESLRESYDAAWEQHEARLREHGHITDIEFETAVRARAVG